MLTGSGWEFLFSLRRRDLVFETENVEPQAHEPCKRRRVRTFTERKRNNAEEACHGSFATEGRADGGRRITGAFIAQGSVPGTA